MIKTFAFASLTANALTTNALTTNGRSIQGLSQQGATKDATPGFRVVAIELPAAR